jgi:hypothetical protein
MTVRHITTSARHLLPLTAIFGLLLTGTEVQRCRDDPAAPLALSRRRPDPHPVVDNGGRANPRANP